MKHNFDQYYNDKKLFNDYIRNEVITTNKKQFEKLKFYLNKSDDEKIINFYKQPTKNPNETVKIFENGIDTLRGNFERGSCVIFELNMNHQIFKKKNQFNELVYNDISLWKKRIVTEKEQPFCSNVIAYLKYVKYIKQSWQFESI